MLWGPHRTPARCLLVWQNSKQINKWLLWLGPNEQGDWSCFCWWLAGVGKENNCTEAIISSRCPITNWSPNMHISYGIHIILSWPAAHYNPLQKRKHSQGLQGCLVTMFRGCIKQAKSSVISGGINADISQIRHWEQAVEELQEATK